jgi:hypothetical protein
MMDEIVCPFLERYICFFIIIIFIAYHTMEWIVSLPGTQHFSMFDVAQPVWESILYYLADTMSTKAQYDNMIILCKLI